MAANVDHYLGYPLQTTANHCLARLLQNQCLGHLLQTAANHGRLEQVAVEQITCSNPQSHLPQSRQSAPSTCTCSIRSKSAVRHSYCARAGPLRRSTVTSRLEGLSSRARRCFPRRFHQQAQTQPHWVHIQQVPPPQPPQPPHQPTPQPPQPPRQPLQPAAWQPPQPPAWQPPWPQPPPQP